MPTKLDNTGVVFNDGTIQTRAVGSSIDVAADGSSVQIAGTTGSFYIPLSSTQYLVFETDLTYLNNNVGFRWLSSAASFTNGNVKFRKGS